MTQNKEYIDKTFEIVKQSRMLGITGHGNGCSLYLLPFLDLQKKIGIVLSKDFLINSDALGI